VIAWGARSDIGRVRENNEDKFDFFLPDDADTLRTRGRLWAVADGMGGHSAGQIASEATLKTVIRTYFGGASDGTEAGADGEDVGERLRRALREAHALISRAAQQFPERGGMGTTATIAVVRGDALTVGHVGDSRAYLLRGDTLRQITNDHSWVEEQVRRGGMTRAEAEKSPYRNVITRSIGMDGALEVDVVREALRPGDVLLLCSDGLSGSLNSALLREHLARAKRENPSWAALRLVDAANEAGGHDNITAVVLTVRRVDDGSDPAAGPPVVH
jgi:protein phosphatase